MIIWQSFKRYRCESNITVFAWRSTWNYAYSPFKYGCESDLPLMVILNLNIAGLGFYWVNPAGYHYGETSIENDLFQSGKNILNISIIIHIFKYISGLDFWTWYHVLPAQLFPCIKIARRIRDKSRPKHK